jgi:hypothetical protein
MRRPLFAVLAVLVAATIAAGHSAAQGSKSANASAKAKAPVQKLESVNACMKYRQQKLVEEGGLRMELRNCCHGPVKCAISWEVRCGRSGKPDARSADLEISAGTTESAYGYGACGNDDWQISGVRWNCESVRTDGRAERRYPPLSG